MDPQSQIPGVFKIEMVPVEKLKPAAYNPRKRLRPGDKAYEDIKRAIGDFGLVQNLVWNIRTGNLVAGHQRLNVGKREWRWKEAPCVVVDLDEVKEKALNILLNRVGEGLWSQSKLADLLAELQTHQIDPTDLGFDESELDALLKKQTRKTERDPDAAAPVPKKPRTKPGDVYHIYSADGHPEHRLICGNARERETWETLLAGNRPQLYLTDPPYGVAYVSKSKTGKMRRQDIQNDDLTKKLLEEFLLDPFRLAHEFCGANASLYCFYAMWQHTAFENALRKAEWDPNQILIWAKQMNLGRANYHWAHEPCFYGGKAGDRPRWYHDRSQTTMWQDDRPDFESMKKEALVELLRTLHDESTVWDEKRDPPTSYIHPNQKPTSLARRAMRHSTLPRDAAVDSFGGSGSTMIAGELQKRSTFTIELEPGFCDSIVTRYVETFPECLLFLNGTEIEPATFKL